MKTIQTRSVLLKTISFAFAMSVLGASTHELHAQTQVRSTVISEGRVSESELISLFSDIDSDPANVSLSNDELMKKFMVRDAKGRIYKIKSYQAQSMGMKFDTQSLVAKGVYFDAEKNKLRYMDSSTPNPIFDRYVDGMPYSAKLDTYYILPQNVIDSLRAQGLQFNVDDQGRIVSITAGEGASQAVRDRLFAGAIDLYQGGGNNVNANQNGPSANISWNNQGNGVDGANANRPNSSDLQAAFDGLGRNGSLQIGAGPNDGSSSNMTWNTNQNPNGNQSSGTLCPDGNCANINITNNGWNPNQGGQTPGMNMTWNNGGQPQGGGAGGAGSFNINGDLAAAFAGLGLGGPSSGQTGQGQTPGMNMNWSNNPNAQGNQNGQTPGLNMNWSNNPSTQANQGQNPNMNMNWSNGGQPQGGGASGQFNLGGGDLAAAFAGLGLGGPSSGQTGQGQTPGMNMNWSNNPSTQANQGQNPSTNMSWNSANGPNGLGGQNSPSFGGDLAAAFAGLGLTGPNGGGLNTSIAHNGTSGVTGQPGVGYGVGYNTYSSGGSLPGIQTGPGGFNFYSGNSGAGNYMDLIAQQIEPAIMGSTFSRNRLEDLSFKSYLLDGIYGNLGYDVIKKDRLNKDWLDDIEKGQGHVSMDINGVRYALTKVQDGDYDLTLEDYVITRQMKMSDGTTQYRLVSEGEHNLFVETAKARLADAQARKDESAIDDWEQLLSNLDRKDSMTYNKAFYDDVRADALDTNLSRRAGSGLGFSFRMGGGFNQGSTLPRGVVPSPTVPSQPSSNDRIAIWAKIIDAHKAKFPQQMSDEDRLKAVNDWALKIAQGLDTTGNPALDAQLKAILIAPAPSAPNAPGVVASNPSAPAALVKSYTLTEIAPDPITGKKRYLLTTFDMDPSTQNRFNSERSIVTEDDVTVDASGKLVLKTGAKGTPEGTPVVPSTSPTVPSVTPAPSAEAPAVNPVKETHRLLTGMTVTTKDKTNGKIVDVEQFDVTGEGIAAEKAEDFIESQNAKLEKKALR